MAHIEHGAITIKETEKELRYHLKEAGQRTIKKLIQLMETGVVEWDGFNHCSPIVCGHSKREHYNFVCPIGIFNEDDDPMPAVGVSSHFIEPWDEGFLDPKWVAGIARQYLTKN